MKIICLLKFVPDVNNFKYDYETNTIIRENVTMILNPDDVKALACALEIKKNNLDCEIEVVSMAPKSITNYLRDYLRMGVDKVTLLSDAKFSGSDSLATSKIISMYLKKIKCDLVLCGTHSLDGDTAHVPNQIASSLDMDYLANVSNLNISNDYVEFEIDDEFSTNYYQSTFPVILGFTKSSKYKLPFIKYADLKLDVDDRINYIDFNTLGIDIDVIGLKGSPTKVVETYTREIEKKKSIYVQTDDASIDKVVEFLKDKELI